MSTLGSFVTVVIMMASLATCHAEDVARISPHGDCANDVTRAYDVRPVNGSATVVVPTIDNWKGIVLILAIGGIAVLFAIFHKLVRTHIYYDAHLLDTFYDAGGDVGVGMISSSVVAKWTWTMTYSWSVYRMSEYGIIAQFWFAAGLVLQLLLFSVVACEIRIKAPGAKTFLQVIYARFGAASHVILTIFALFLNLAVGAMVMFEGTNMLHALIADVPKEIISVILSIAIALFTVIGGVGGYMYVAYVACLFIFGTLLFFYVEVFYNPSDRQAAPYGDWEAIYRRVDCLKASSFAENEANSPVTFLSRGGMIEGVLLLLSGFSSVFVNQSFWQSTVTSKPTQTVWGFILGALAWFAIPFGFAFSLGSAYQVMTVNSGAYPVPAEQAAKGLVPLYVSQQLLKSTGDYLMMTLTTLVVLTTAAGEVLSASSIIIYDIYMTYIAPFKPSGNNNDTNSRSRRAVNNEQYLEYDKRCLVLKHVVVIVLSLLLIPLTIALLVLDVDLLYLFKFLGVVCGSCVIPVTLAITWHRTTGVGVSLGCAGGLVAGVVAWLVSASRGSDEFYANTGRWEAMLAGTSASLGVGGLIVVLTSLCCGGCDSDRMEEEEWEKTRGIDNQILPWAVKYAPEFKNMKMKGIPHFYAVRRTFKCAEISAYIVGVLLAVICVLVWPACMLLVRDWPQRVFGVWNTLVIVWVGAASVYICLVPLIGEIVLVCRQSYYNRKWTERSQTDTRPLEEEQHTQPERPLTDTQSIKTVESDFHSTMGHDSGVDTTSRHERWKTFIHLD